MGCTICIPQNGKDLSLNRSAIEHGADRNGTFARQPHCRQRRLLNSGPLGLPNLMRRFCRSIAHFLALRLVQKF